MRIILCRVFVLFVTVLAAVVLYGERKRLEAVHIISASTPSRTTLLQHIVLKKTPHLGALSCPGVAESFILDSHLFDQLQVRKTRTKQPFWISTHDEGYDRLRHDIYKKGYYYEKWFTHLIEQIASTSFKDDYVIDVGANIGWISLVAASLGMQTLSFEPNPRNIVRLCQTIFLNDFKGMKVFPIGVADKDGRLYFREDKANPGESTVRSKRKSSSDVEIAVRSLDSVLFEEGFFSFNQLQKRIALLKIDVEGLEDKVLLGSMKLLASGRVATVVHEFQHHKWQKERNRNIHSLLVSQNYEVKALYFATNRSIILNDTEVEATTRSYDTLMSFCSRMPNPHCNLLWRIRSSTKDFD